MRRLTAVGIAIAAGALAAPAAAGAAGLPPSASKDLRRAVTARELRPYLERIEDISLHHGPAGTRAPDGHRADGDGQYRLAGTAGDEQTATYIARTLRRSGYDPQTTHFDFPFFEELSPAHFERLTPSARGYVEPDDFATMQFSGAGDVTGRVVPTNDVMVPPDPTPGTSSSGCEASDFTPASSTQPEIALVQRGTCTFAAKAQNAQAAGYDAVIIFNEGQPGRTETVSGTLGGASQIPVIGASFAVGEELYNLAKAGDTTAHVTTNTNNETRQSHNVVADTKRGTNARTVLVGAHTDSTADGPAINDDGTGMAFELGMARALARQRTKLRNEVRFGFWGAEEEGLLGSADYASKLTPEQVGQIAVNLSFDMLASDNSIRAVYDGDGSDSGIPGPAGSGAIEQVFTDYFADRGLPTQPTPLDGRTDYASFTDIGIPAGGLFAGAEELKTPEEAATYGGVAGQPYYVCYHQACDTVATIYGVAGTAFDPAPPGDLATFRNAGLGRRTYTQLAGGAAHAILTFADVRTKAKRARATRARRAALRSRAARRAYRGPRLGR